MSALTISRDFIQLFPNLGKLREEGAQSAYDKNIIRLALDFAAVYQLFNDKEKDKFNKSVPEALASNKSLETWYENTLGENDIHIVRKLAEFANQFHMEVLENLCYFYIAKLIEGKSKGEIHQILGLK